MRRKKLNGLQKKLDELRMTILSLKKPRSLRADWKELYRSIDKSLPSTLLISKSLKIGWRAFVLNYSNEKASWKTQRRKNERRTRHNTRITVIQEQTDAFLKELAEFQDILGKQEGLLSNLEILEKVLQYERTSCLQD